MEKNRIVAYHENNFSVSQEVVKEQLMDIKVGVGINPMLRYKEGTDAIGCQIHVLFDVDGKPIMDYGAVLTIIVPGWNELLKNNPTDNQKINASKEAWIRTIDFVRGAICASAAKSSKSIVASLMLPEVDIEKFMENVSIEKVV